MLILNCNAHPVLSLMHRLDLGADQQPLPPNLQDKRTIMPLEQEVWERWLHGSRDDAASLIQLPAADLYTHAAADPEKQVPRPVTA